MIDFTCDYSEGTHPAILKRLVDTNFEQTPGYGEDRYCQAAREKIRTRCGDVDVHFLVGGTQANLTVIAFLLKPWQGVLCADTGHINQHETGAIEATGHKVLSLPSRDGKITATQVEQAVREHQADATHEHRVQPGMVFIGSPTECGTVYTREELLALSKVCRRYNLPLYLDGARLGYGMAIGDSSLRWEDLTACCDIFYIGGTKVGALFGEAVIIVNPALRTDFRYIMKQRGAMLAKGRLLGLQFDTLFTDHLYETISRHAVEQAQRIRSAFLKKGIPLLFDSPTNQQFPILHQDQQAFLSQNFSFCYWEKVDENRDSVRFCTSWATRDEDVTALIQAIEQMP